jgi:cyclophilin family peptidyl-prolyl cis-trans isomerase
MPKRRLRRDAPEEDESSLPLGAAVAILGLVLIIVIAIGVGMNAAASPAPTGPFSRCKTAAEVGPRQYAGPPAMCIDATRGYRADIETTKGKVTVVLLASKAPLSVNNFIVLAVNGYYTGLNFWRIEDWVVQTGDPTGTGRGGPGYSIPEEPGANDPWKPGSLGFARPPDSPNLNGGQFFITKTAWPGGEPTVVYNHFATVTLGFENVSQLSPADRITRITVTQTKLPSPTISPSASPSPSPSSSPT